MKRLVLCLALATPSAVFAKPSLVVKTDAGAVQGESENGVDTWKGIPFAAPPVGALRWRAPQPPAPWTGVKTTTAYSHDCMQVPTPGDYAPLGTPPAEDCLYLNLWRPAAASGRLPVLVWIYGGGFVNGGASPPTYSGANLAAQGVVLVSFNYRVGRFGTFAHPQLTRADADHGLLGNYGYLDQIAALRWVQRNIASFGGDPAKVTVMGESAGGMSVLNLLTTPMAQGLFTKAIVMSGGNGETLDNGSLQSAEKVGADFGQSLGIAPTDPDALAKLRAVSAEGITNGLNMFALAGKGPRTFSSPFVDGRIAVGVAGPIQQGKFSRVPVMIGATSGDIGGETGFMVAGARKLAKLLAGQGQPVYAYRFSYVPDSRRTPDNAPAGHATDVPFFFDTQSIRYGAETSDRDNRVGALISAYVTSFAISGDPNGASRTAWPRYDGKRDVLLDFSVAGMAVAQSDPLGVKLDAMPEPRADIPPPK